MAVLTAYNRTNMKMMFIMTAFFFVLAEALFRIMYYNTVAKVRTHSVQYTQLYFFCRVFCPAPSLFFSFSPFSMCRTKFSIDVSSVMIRALRLLITCDQLLHYCAVAPHLSLTLPLFQTFFLCLFLTHSLSLSIQNALTFIPYFFTGTFAASVLENMHVAMWDWNRREAVNKKSKS